jgi:TolB-like protein/DNA-binding winged helix-turn-helix (wHTH) protein/Tfp pilus assembly protein PilF
MQIMETRYTFDQFELDARTFELRRSGEHVRLEPIPLELLLLLVSRHGDLVSREEIIGKLWGNETFIDSNTAINVAVRKIRQVLDDKIENPRYILTVPAKGYRFVGSISAEPAKPANGNSSNPVSLAPAPTHALQAQPRPSSTAHRAHRSWWIWISAILLLGVATTAVVRSRHHSPATKQMFVILPFENLTGDPAQEYIADGMTEEMISRMGGLDPEHLGVIARTSAMNYKGTHKSASEIARELGVSYLLEGSIGHVGDRVRVTAQLIQASDQTHMWSSEYDSDLGNLLQLESDVAGAIAQQVRIKLVAGTPARYTQEVVPESQVAYLRGLADWNLRTHQSITDATEEFKRAIAIDPNYALPYAALARCYAIGPIFGVGSPLETMPLARDLSVRALKLDPGLAEAHSILAMVAAHYDLDWTTAEREFLLALRLNPSDPYAHLFYSNSFLSPHARHREAVDEMQKAIALDPLSPPVQAFLIRTYTWARSYDDARAQFAKTMEVAPNMPLLHERAAHLFTYTGDLKKAIVEDAQARLLSGEPAEQVIADRDQQVNALRQRGAQGYWQAQLDLSREKFHPPEAFVTPFGLAVIYSRLGSKDLALSALQEAYERRDVQLTEMQVEPAFDVLRDDARFRTLLSRIGLGYKKPAFGGEHGNGTPPYSTRQKQVAK